MPDEDMTQDRGSFAAEAGPLLSLKDIAGRTGIPYDRLVNWAQKAGEELGGVRVKGAKGLRYPYSAIGLFRKLDQYRVPAGSAAAYLRDAKAAEAAPGELPAPISEKGISQLPELPMPPIDSQAVLSAIEEGTRRAIERTAERDAMIPIKRAHTEFGVSMAALKSMSFIEGGRRKVLLSDVQSYIEQFAKRAKGNTPKC